MAREIGPFFLCFRNVLSHTDHMQLHGVEIREVAGSPDVRRVSASLEFDDASRFELWAEIPERNAAVAATSGNAWVIAMLPMAAARGEDIRMSLSVDALLLENLHGVLEIWRGWYAQVGEIRIFAPVAEFESGRRDRVAAFYSGGIDSYFTVARRVGGAATGVAQIGRLDTLVSVWGFDVKVDDAVQFGPLARALEIGASKLGLQQVVVRTNLRVAEPLIRFKDAWRKLSHGAGLAFVAHLLAADHGEVVIGSSHTYGRLFPWGSDPMLDPLYSASGLRITHDGAMYSRTAKTDVVGRFEPASKSLHVCLAQGQSNCSHCEKCYRTMMTLDIFGHKDLMRDAFDWSLYDVRNIRRFVVRTDADRLFRDEILAAASARGRNDIVDAFAAATRRSLVVVPILKFSERLMLLPGIWRLGMSLKVFMSRGPIRKI